MQEKLKEFSQIEETLRSALLNAQKSATEMKEKVEDEAKIIIEKAEMEAKSLKQQVIQREDLVKNEIDNLRRYKFNFKEKFKSMLNLYLKMIESEDFEEKGNYKIEEEVSKEKAEKRVSGEKVDKLEGLGIEENFKIKETEDEQRYQ
ncbi:hypothetical protein ES708_24755 [subsurface metagenome]|jgi:cell division initiation protein